MREIRFRAWDTFNKTHRQVSMLDTYGTFDKQALYFLDDLKGEDGRAYMHTPPTELEQYTGRTAQCTDEIYEHDICIVTTFDHNGTDTQYQCVVEWCNGGFAFVNKEKDIFIPLWDIEDTDSDVEIIGNIHDNPELLEASHE